ncbi:hypothetical protein C9374_006145 [Naegleria lovaniensis]|uniref:Formate/nitrite transporter n=1 Tax=Naegleria lovaniensis TaxID=51637 RepID=A0AA88GMA6_NAELO|nr:uncharacterized protein C9374_006145 [Naegleria lovaniensis]KAG2381761.1 hypothetical protein C9374_006145 [Naegleria lovaniensis]
MHPHDKHSSSQNPLLANKDSRDVELQETVAQPVEEQQFMNSTATNANVSVINASNDNTQNNSDRNVEATTRKEDDEIILEDDQHLDIHYKPPSILHHVIADKSIQFSTLPSSTTQSEHQQHFIHHHYHHFTNSESSSRDEKKNPLLNEKQPSSTIPTTTQPQQTTHFPSIVLFNTPFQVMEKMKSEGVRKSKLTVDQLIILSLFAGIFKGIGCTLSLLTAGNSRSLEEENPGLQKFFFGAVFPIGLVLISATGAELFTANVLVLLVGLFSRKWRSKKFFIQFTQFSKNLFVSYVFNMLGAFLMAYFFVYLSQPCCTAYWIEYIKNLAVAKTSRSFGACLASGIVCNILVTMAVYNSQAATTMEGKILGIWFPIMTFVASGYEHCVANAFFIPLGMLYGANVSLYDFFIGNLLPSTIGNIIGGALVIGCLLYYVYDYRNRHKRILFNVIEFVWGKIKEKYRARNPTARLEQVSTQS